MTEQVCDLTRKNAKAKTVGRIATSLLKSFGVKLNVG
jgi:hypothetical protein